MLLPKAIPPKYAHIKIKKHAHANLPMVGANDHDFGVIINLIKGASPSMHGLELLVVA